MVLLMSRRSTWIYWADTPHVLRDAFQDDLAALGWLKQGFICTEYLPPRLGMVYAPIRRLIIWPRHEVSPPQGQR